MMRHLIFSNSLAAFTAVVITMMTSSGMAGIGQTPGRCENLFISTVDSKSMADLPDIATAKISEVILKKAGEEFLHIEKIDATQPWGSRYAPHEYDPQGDPSQVFDVLGADLSAVMGFSRNERGDLIVPTPETYNRRIARFNRYLMTKNIAPIAVSFYSQPKPRIESYLRHWAQLLQIPVAAGNTTHTIHDVAYHYTAILLPVAVVRLLTIQAGIAWQWLHSEHGHTLPMLPMNSVRRVDHISASANSIPGAENLSHLRYWRNIFADEDDPSLPARSRSHIYIFRERLSFYNRTSATDDSAPVFTNVREETDAFFKRLKIDFPDWDLPVAASGLRDYETLRELYTARAVELRHAAYLYRKEAQK